MDTNLVIKAFQKASKSRELEPGSIFHSDRGSQYTAREFEKLLETMGIKHSYSKKGYPYDNAPMESFHSCFKKEDERMNKYIDFNDAKMSTFEYIESWYNRKRIHSRIGFMTPQDYEDLILKSA